MTEQKRDVQGDLAKLEAGIADLKVQYEQYFSGISLLPPDKLHAEMKRSIRALLKAPFKSSATNFHLKMLVNRYQALDTYFRRVLREREEGTYHKDVFKANLRERIAREEAFEQTAEGAAEKRMHSLYQTYCDALERASGKQVNVDYKAFRQSVVSRAKDLKQKNPGKKVSFKITINAGKVAVQANLKD